MDFVQLMSSLSLNDTAEVEESETIFKPVTGIVLNEQTEILTYEFTNRIFCGITQYEKIGGSMYSVTKRTTSVGSDDEPLYIIKPLLGSDDILHTVAVRYIVERLNISKPLIIFLSLKNYELPMIQGICNLILNSDKNETNVQ